MLGSIYHMTLKVIWNQIFGMKTLIIVSYICDVIVGVEDYATFLSKPRVVYRF